MREKKTPTSTTKGVIYYNAGRGALVRLTVSLHTLRKIYNGPITILCDVDSLEHCLPLKDLFGVNIVSIKLAKLRKNRVLLTKCLLHKVTPYEKSIYIDADTIIFKDPTEYIFDKLNYFDFVVPQFSNWTTKTRKIKKRLAEWKDVYPELYKESVKPRVAINTGTFGFNKQSTLMRDWYKLAVKGKQFFIPDEVCCQLMLGTYPYSSISMDFNTSCKLDDITDNTYILHYHGRKNCRWDGDKFSFNAHLWVEQFKQIRNLDIIKDNIYYERQLRKNIKYIN